MKILFVSPTGSFFSGAEVAISNLMTYLSTNGHQIYNVIPDNGIHRDQAYLDKMAQSGIKLYELSSPKWWWLDKDEVAEYEKDGFLATQHQTITKVRQIIQEQRIDVVVSNTVNVFQGAIAAACEQLPHYYIIHEFPEGEFAYYQEKIQLINALSQKIFVVKGELYRTLLDVFPKDKLIPFIPYTHFGHHQLSLGERQRLVSIGGINERKNQLELIEAFHQLGRDDMELLFIGGWDQAYKERCDDYIERHKLTNISFLGHQVNPWDFITDKDLMVFTSKTEAFPLVYAEAVLNGVPTIISDNGGHMSVRDFFGTGIVYPLGDINVLCRTIEKALNQLEALKVDALAKQEQARTSYAIEELSQSFEEQFTKQSDSSELVKIFSQAKTFFNLELNQTAIDHVLWNRVTVFFADDRGSYSSERSFVKTLKDQDSFEVVIDTEQKVRIDLSEYPLAYQKVELRSLSSGMVLQPILHNVLMLDDYVLAYDNDPQLVYDVSSYAGETLVFSYVKLEENSLSLILKDHLDHSKQSLAQLEIAYQELNQNYHAVIGSRRWLWTSKAIHLFKKLMRKS